MRPFKSKTRLILSYINKLNSFFCVFSRNRMSKQSQEDVLIATKTAIWNLGFDKNKKTDFAGRETCECSSGNDFGDGLPACVARL
jgi:hypothetical protein